MKSSQTTYLEKKVKLSNRLSRIGGQVQAIKKMVDADQPCLEVAQQLSAARAALDKAYFEMMSCAIEQSVRDGVESDGRWQRELETLTQVLVKYA